MVVGLNFVLLIAFSLKKTSLTICSLLIVGHDQLQGHSS